MEIRYPKGDGNRVRPGVTDAELKKLHEDTAREFPKYAPRMEDYINKSKDYLEKKKD